MIKTLTREQNLELIIMQLEARRELVEDLLKAGTKSRRATRVAC